MKGFLERVEERILLEHEASMKRPALVVAPHACARCQRPLSITRGKGRIRRWCSDCRDLMRRECVRRAQEVWRRRNR